MRIMTLFTAALLFAALSQIGAGAQAEAVAEDAFVTVTFGAVMMQVPARLAEQLCPDVEPEQLDEATMRMTAVACNIPHEEYTSHDPNVDPGGR